MTDHQLTSSPEIVPPEGGTAQSKTQTAVHATRAAARAAAEEGLRKPERPWFKKKRFALPSAVILLFGVIMVTTGGNDAGIVRAVTNAAQPSGANPAKAPATANIGQSVRDGRFSFVVTSVDRPAKSFTDRFGAMQKAQGMFVTVRVDVTNIGYEARTMTATDLFLLDGQGRRFATSSAILTLGGAEKIFLQEINPGHTVNNAPVLFDVAPETVIDDIELHDSSSSTGTRVKLH